MSKHLGERYRLTLPALPSDTPTFIRLRHVLKSLLRAWDFQAEKVEELLAETVETGAAETTAMILPAGPQSAGD